MRVKKYWLRSVWVFPNEHFLTLPFGATNFYEMEKCYYSQLQRANFAKSNYTFYFTKKSVTNRYIQCFFCVKCYIPLIIPQ